MEALVLDIKHTTVGNRLRFTVQITHQKYRGDQAYFVSSKGFIFDSASYPALSPLQDMLYLRGSMGVSDLDTMYTHKVGYIAKLQEAVKEYNIAK